jgi:hypothetical protein
MSKPPKKLKGRPATDARGNATWKWVGEAGTVETDLIKALGEGLSLEPAPQKANVDPYSKSPSQDKEKPKGRSLDDMRRLDEEMKREHAKLVADLRKRAPGAQPTHGVRLRFDDRELLVDKRHASVTIGRGEDNDVVLSGERISRLHARIEISRNKVVLIDESTNGTYVHTADGEQSFVRRGSLQLKGQGMIGLGRRPRQDSARTIRFSCEEV